MRKLIKMSMRIAGLLAYGKTWDELKGLRRATFFKFSAAIFIVHPILVKTGMLANSILSFPVFLTGGQPLIVSVPFSISVLYAGALFVFFGNIMFLIFCPPVVKKFDNYTDYATTGMTTEYLKKLCRTSAEDSEVKAGFALGSGGEENARKIFTRCYMIEREANKIIRYFVLAMFYVGFALAFFVAAQNIYVSVIAICFGG